jgi:hypothetical protein
MMVGAGSVGGMAHGWNMSTAPENAANCLHDNTFRKLKLNMRNLNQHRYWEEDAVAFLKSHGPNVIRRSAGRALQLARSSASSAPPVSPPPAKVSLQPQPATQELFSDTHFRGRRSHRSFFNTTRALPPSSLARISCASPTC